MKKPLSATRYFIIPIHFLVPHILRMLILFLGYIFSFFFIQDFLLEVKHTGYSSLLKEWEYISFQLTFIGIGLVLLFIVIRMIGRWIATWLCSAKAFWITFTLSAFSLIFTIATVDYKVTGTRWWLDLILCIFIMLAYGIGGSSKKRLKYQKDNDRMERVQHEKVLPNEDPFEILKKDIEEKEKAYKGKTI